MPTWRVVFTEDAEHGLESTVDVEAEDAVEAASEAWNKAQDYGRRPVSGKVDDGRADRPRLTRCAYSRTPLAVL